MQGPQQLRLDARRLERGQCAELTRGLAEGRQQQPEHSGTTGVGSLLRHPDDRRASPRLERRRPFGIWVHGLRCSPASPDPRRAAIAALLTPRASAHQPITVSSDPGLQFQAVDAVVDLVEDLAHEAPLALGLDDLQWADPSSLLALAALARRLAHAPVALIGCLRLTPRGQDLERALSSLDRAGARTVRLGRLSDRAVVDLVTDVLATEPGRTLVAEVAGAGGNPLFVTELVAALVRDDMIETLDGRAEVSGTALPSSLRPTILRLLGFLPEPARAALHPAAVLGTSFTPSDLATTTDRSVLDLSAALATAVTARVLVDDGDRLRFRHDLIRDAVYEHLPRSVRLGLHREAGRRLARAGAPALQVAEHLARGAVPGDAEAVDWLTRAAREAAPRSPGVAAELLKRAVDLLDPIGP